MGRLVRYVRHGYTHRGWQRRCRATRGRACRSVLQAPGDGPGPSHGGRAREAKHDRNAGLGVPLAGTRLLKRPEVGGLGSPRSLRTTSSRKIGTPVT